METRQFAECSNVAMCKWFDISPNQAELIEFSIFFRRRLKIKHGLSHSTFSPHLNYFSIDWSKLGELGCFILSRLCMDAFTEFTRQTQFSKWECRSNYSSPFSFRVQLKIEHNMENVRTMFVASSHWALKERKRMKETNLNLCSIHNWLNYKKLISGIEHIIHYQEQTYR